MQSLLLDNDGGWAMSDFHLVFKDDAGGGTPGFTVRTPEETAELSDAQLREMPFFGPFGDMSVCGTNGSEVAAARHAYYMSTCIPAESYAAGANPLPLPGVENKDMATYSCKGKRITYFWGSEDYEWNHGFYINAPIFRTYDFYHDIITHTKERN